MVGVGLGLGLGLGLGSRRPCGRHRRRGEAARVLHDAPAAPRPLRAHRPHGELRERVPSEEVGLEEFAQPGSGNALHRAPAEGKVEARE